MAVSAPAGIRAQAAPSAACVQDKDQFTCNATTFAAALKNASTIKVESQPTNEIANGELAGIVRSLGKTSAPGQADLTFVLVKVDYDGINYGPSDRELASLRVYSRGEQGARGPLVWVEPFFGQPDMSWPAVVQALIHQFKAHTKEVSR